MSLNLIFQIFIISLASLINSICHSQENYIITQEIDSLFSFDLDTTLWRIQNPEKTQKLMRISLKDKDKAGHISVLSSYTVHKNSYISLPSINIVQTAVPDGIRDIDAVLGKYDNSNFSTDIINDILTYKNILTDVEVIEPLINKELKSIFEIFSSENKLLGRVITEQHTFIRKFRMIMIQLSYLESDVPGEHRNNFYSALGKLR